MNSFRKYNSIENLTNKELERIHTYVDLKEVWYVTEKIHGSNFSVYLDKDGQLKSAKRTNVLDNEEPFFNHLTILDKYGKALSNIIGEIWAWRSVGSIIYMELCGGRYDHTNVEKVQNAKIVQKEVQYCPGNEIVVYDIFTEGSSGYLNHEEVIRLCNKYKIPVVPIAFKGDIDSCIRYCSDHLLENSEIGNLVFDLPKLENNIKEGYVIKPHTSLFFGDHRVILKYKNEKFKEQKGTKEKKVNVPKTYSSIVTDLIHDGHIMICSTRFDNVTSKFGEYSIRNFKELMDLMTQDIIEELEKLDEYNNLGLQDKHDVKKSISSGVQKFMVDNKVHLF